LTTEQFIEKVEGYYNVRYPAGQKLYIAKYLSTLSERSLDFMFTVCLKNYSAKWGKAPDIAVFEELRPEVRDELAGDTQGQNLSRPALEDKSDYVSDEDRAMFLAAVQDLGSKMRVKK